MELFAEFTPQDWALFFGLIAALGCTAGFLAGLLGIGGGVVLVPGLYYLFSSLGFQSDVLMHVCVGTSLAIIVPTGFSSARSHYKRGGVDFVRLKQIGIGVAAGVVIGTVLASALAGDTLKLIFAIAIAVLALIMMIDPKRFTLVQAFPRQPVPSLAGVVIGTVSTLIGVGGATMSVPFMSLCHTPIRTAIGTASALGLVISIPAAIGFILIGWGADGLPPFSLGYVNMAAWAVIIPVSVMVAPLGSRAAHVVPVEIMRKGFAAFMVVVAMKMVMDLMG